jgi:hypothetical protein
MAQAAAPGYGSAMSYLFDPVVPTVPVAGSSRSFPVRRIFCIGRNYAAHVREMGGDPAKGDPVVFMKPADAVVPGGGRLAYPPDTADLHHEVELVAALGRPLHRASPDEALDAVFGYAVGIDLTKRDRQGEAKTAGLPWERAKSFEHSAPISAIVAASRSPSAATTASISARSSPARAAASARCSPSCHPVTLPPQIRRLTSSRKASPLPRSAATWPKRHRRWICGCSLG